MSYVTKLASDIEQFMFERGEYEFEGDDRIRWLCSNERECVVNNLIIALRTESKALKEYFEDQLVEMFEEDESVFEAKRIIAELESL